MSATENDENIQSITTSSDSNTTSGSTQVSILAPNLNSNQAENVLTLQQQQQYQPQLQQHHRNNSRRGLVHSVSIIVEPAIADGDDSGLTDDNSSPSMSSERRNTIAGPIVLLEDFPFEPPRKAREEDDIVQSIIAHARLRKEEFARLLEEHAQIVNEINRAETSLL